MSKQKVIARLRKRLATLTPEARAERLRVLRLKEQTGHAVLDDIRDAADIRRDGRAAHARAGGYPGKRFRAMARRRWSQFRVA